MEQPWTYGERETRNSPAQATQPMSQEEALEIVRKVAVQYMTEERLTVQFDDWIAGCTDEFGD